MSIGHDEAARVPETQVFDDAFHKSLVDHLSDGVYYVDRRRCILYWNHGAERITGFDAAEVVGRRCSDGILAHVDDAGRQLCQALCPLVASVRADEPRELEVWLRHHDGHRVPVRVRTAPIHDADGRVTGAVEVFDDASRLIDARTQAAAASRDALSDALTGLPNRRHVDIALEGRLADLRRYGWSFGLLVLDVDHFKAVNDTHGHDVGDQALRTVAATIAGGVRAGDLVGRWGGEEFVILANGGDERSLRDVAERCRALVASATVQVGDSGITIRVSVGAAVALASDDAGTLFARADAALYRAKEDGRDRVVVASVPA